VREALSIVRLREYRELMGTLQRFVALRRPAEPARAQPARAASEEERATTAISVAELHGLVMRTGDASPEARATEAIAPIIIIVDRPPRVVDGPVQPIRRTRITLSSPSKMPALERPLARGTRTQAAEGGVSLAVQTRSRRAVLGYVALAALACLLMWQLL
jgi:hypothetical protein